MKIGKLLRLISCFLIICQVGIGKGDVYQYTAGSIIKGEISKTGLNRISNPPYRGLVEEHPKVSFYFFIPINPSVLVHYLN